MRWDDRMGSTEGLFSWDGAAELGKLIRILLIHTFYF